MPKVRTKMVMISIPPDALAEIDNWIANQQTILNRSTLIRIATLDYIRQHTLGGNTNG